MPPSVRLRLASAADAPALAAIYAPAVTSRATSFEYTAPTAEEMGERVRRITARLPWLVADDAGRGVIGYAYASPYRDRTAYQWSAEVSAYVDERAQRRGVARALYTALFEILRLQGYRNAYAGVTLPNEASEAFHRSMGFEPVGVFRHVGYKHGAWRDVAWSALAIGPYDAQPHEPLPLAEIVDRPEFAAAFARGEQIIR